jgi:Ankyrin repeats (3 copies)/Ankyrin repeat
MYPVQVMKRRILLRIGLAVGLLGAAACTQRPETPMTQAAARNDAAALRRLLADGHKADEADSWTALIWAARSGSVDAIAVLLDAGADVNRPGPTGDGWDATPLEHAILARQPGAVRLLLERGADPKRGAARSLTPLFLAAGDTDPAFVKLLLAHGADPGVEDENGATPLARAVAAGTFHGPDRPMFGGCRVETVRALVAHDPAPGVKRNAAWKDAIWWARFQRCGEVLKLIGE